MPKKPKNPYEEAIREMVERPEGAKALGIMKMVDDILRVNKEFADGVVTALARHEESGGSEESERAVQDAIQAWEKACDAVMTPALLDDFRQEADELIQRRKRIPPRCAEILDGWDPERKDLGYSMAGMLDGPEGTLHRLWGAISSDLAFAAIGVNKGEPAAPEIKDQFEASIGRPMTTAEWARLEERGRRHAEEVMIPLLKGMRDR